MLPEDRDSIHHIFGRLHRDRINRKDPLGFLLLGVALSWLLSGATGCATSRGILDVQVPASSNPSQGNAYKIVAVRDVRVFELKPGVPSTPSLKNAEIDDLAITSRAIARKRNGYGKALGDILLPEAGTVQELTGAAITRGFRESGLRVVAPGDSDWERATPVEADILQLWAWMTPGFWTISLDFDMRVRIKTALGAFRDGDEVQAAIQLHTGGAGARQWFNTITSGLEAFNVDLKEQLARAIASD